MAYEQEQQKFRKGCGRRRKQRHLAFPERAITTGKAGRGVTLAGFYRCIKDTVTKNNLGRKGLICLTLPHHNPSLKKAKQELKSGAGRQGLKERPWKDTNSGLLPRLALPASLYNPGPPVLRGGTVHSGLDPPSSLIYQ